MFTTKQANHANYSITAICLAILLTRIAVGRYRGKPLDLAFCLLLLSILSVTARITLNCYYLQLGTVNDAIANPRYYETHDPRSVELGSKLLIGARTAVSCSLWLQISLLLLFYSQILHGIPWVKIMIRLTWVATGISFVAAVLFTFLECKPIHLYWQTNPSPGECVKAYEQLLCQCICNIVLDLMLLTISFPILLNRRRTWIQHLRVSTLFILGTFCLVVTIMRLVAVYGNGGQQAVRTLWAAIQIGVSTFVANVPTIYGDVKVLRRKKQEVRERRSSRPDSSFRTSLDEEATIQGIPNELNQRLSHDLRPPQKMKELESSTEVQQSTTIPDTPQGAARDQP